LRSVKAFVKCAYVCVMGLFGPVDLCNGFSSLLERPTGPLANLFTTGFSSWEVRGHPSCYLCCSAVCLATSESPWHEVTYYISVCLTQYECPHMDAWIPSVDDDNDSRLVTYCIIWGSEMCDLWSLFSPISPHSFTNKNSRELWSWWLFLKGKCFFSTCKVNVKC